MPYRWAFLDLQDSRTDGTFQDVELARTAGYLEGKVTAPLIEMHWRNTFTGYCDDNESFCTKLRSFLTENDAYCAQKFENLKKSAYYIVRKYLYSCPLLFSSFYSGELSGQW